MSSLVFFFYENNMIHINIKKLERQKNKKQNKPQTKFKRQIKVNNKNKKNMTNMSIS